jgi:hypothetical protein
MRMTIGAGLLVVLLLGSPAVAEDTAELKALLQLVERRLAAIEGEPVATAGERVTEIGGATRRQPPVEQVSKLVVRIYDLSDLFTIAPPYVAQQASDLRTPPAETTSVFQQSPSVFRQNSTAVPTGAGLGGGIFSVGERDDSKSSAAIPRHVLPQFGGFGLVHGDANDHGVGRISFNQLIDAITGTIEPETWEASGGEATIQSLGNSLIVRATPDIHKQVDNLLNLFRQKWGTLRTVSVEAWWLWMSEAQSLKFFADARPKGEHRSVGAAVDNAAFEAHLAALAVSDTERPGYRARITCYNGQVVHTIAGGQQLLVTDILPIVGDNSLGYRPVVSVVQEGAALQVRPNVTRLGKYVALDVHSRVNLLSTIGKAPAAPAEAGDEKPAADVERLPTDGPGRTTAALDRPEMRNSRLSTSLRVPVDQTMLVGAMSFDSDPLPGSQNLYLFVKLSVQELRDDLPEEAAGEGIEPK